MINRRFSFFPWAAMTVTSLSTMTLIGINHTLVKTLRDIALLVTPFVYRKEENMRKGKGKTPRL